MQPSHLEVKMFAEHLNTGSARLYVSFAVAILKSGDDSETSRHIHDGNPHDFFSSSSRRILAVTSWMLQGLLIKRSPPRLMIS